MTSTSKNKFLAIWRRMNFHLAGYLLFNVLGFYIILSVTVKEIFRSLLAGTGSKGRDSKEEPLLDEADSGRDKTAV